MPLEQEQVAADSEEKLQKGDSVVVYTRKGQTDEYEVVELEDSGFVGTAWDHKRYRVRYANLDRIWVKRQEWSICTVPIHT